MLFGKITTVRFNFFILIKQNVVVYFPGVVRDNVVSNDVTITSSLSYRCDNIRNKFSRTIKPKGVVFYCQIRLDVKFLIVIVQRN